MEMKSKNNPPSVPVHSGRRAPLVFSSLLGLAMGAAAVVGGAAKVEPPAKLPAKPPADLVPITVPARVRGTAAPGVKTMTATRTIKTKRGPAQVAVEVTNNGRIVSIRLSKHLAGLRSVRDVLNQPEESRTLSECIDTDKCNDKPTREGVAGCIINCAAKVLEEALDEILFP